MLIPWRVSVSIVEFAQDKIQGVTSVSHVSRPVAWALLAPPPSAPASVAVFTSGKPEQRGHAVGWHRGPLRKLHALKTSS